MQWRAQAAAEEGSPGGGAGGVLPGAQDPVPGGRGPGAWEEVSPGDDKRVPGGVADSVQASDQEQVHHRDWEGAQGVLRYCAQGGVSAGNKLSARSSICSHK